MNDDIPELEDFSDELSRIKLNKKTNSPKKINVNIVNKQDKQTEKPERKEESFGGGFKKGFFKSKADESQSQGQNQSQSQSNSKKEEVIDLTHIKSNTENRNQLKDLNENQENNKDSLLKIGGLLDNKQNWLTQDLFTKLAQNPNLLKAFMHPSFSEVMTLLQKNPEEAKRKYGDSKEFNEFFKEFFQLMSEHFKELGKKETDKFLKESVQKDSQIERILNEPKVIKALEVLKSKGRLDGEDLNNDEELIKNIEVLIKKGVLKTINK